jgi:peptidoglycan/LPS O-acetylase OafA/YrhL
VLDRAPSDQNFAVIDRLPAEPVSKLPPPPDQAPSRETGTPHSENAESAPARGPRPRVRVLDGLRLVAALMVVCWHYAAFGHGATLRPAVEVPGLYHIAAYGWLGVELFFLISGFVISMSAMGRTVGEFATSRFTRLFPAYWLGIALTATVLWLWPIARPGPSLSDVGVNLTMLQEGFHVPAVDAVYWTLFAELRFYLLFALVVWRGVTYNRAVAFCCIWLLASAITYSSTGLIHNLVMPDWAPFFIAGIAFFLMHRYGSNVLLWCLVGACFALSQRQAFVSARSNFRFLGEVMPKWPVVAILAAFYLLVAAVALGWLRVDWRWLTVAGVLTYPLYLIHEYIGWTLFAALRGAAPDTLLFVGVVAVMLATAWLIHRYVEKPLAPRIRKAMLGPAMGRRRAPWQSNTA